jgi:hypothetical protein
MRRVFISIFLSLVLLTGFLAYNAYTYHELSSAEGAYKLAVIPEKEKLIAVYHGDNLWQFATYDEETNTLKLYNLKQSSILDLKDRSVEKIKAMLNYSPLTLDPKLLKEYTPHTRALLFKPLGWKYDNEISGSYWRNLSEVIKPGEEYYKIYGVGTSRKLWIKRKEVCEKASIFAHDYVCYGYIGVSGILVIPGYEGERMLWVIEKPHDNQTEMIAYYPGITLKKTKTPEENQKPRNYTGEDGKIILEMLNKLKGNKTEYVQIVLYEKLKRLPGYRGLGWSLGSGGYCHVEACCKDLAQINISKPWCVSRWRLRDD